jgi:hypothetical protein
MTETVVERPLPTGEGLTFEKVWAMFQETDKKFQETDKKFQETDRQFKETDKKFQETREQLMKETDRRIKETERLIKQNNEQFGDLGRRFGEIVEHLVAPGIEEKFNKMGYHFSEVTDRHRIKDENGQKKAEIDILLENGETILAVEVKSKPNNNDIKEHIKRLKILRESRREKKDGRRIIGGIAGAVFKNNVKEAAQKAGLYVMVQSGDTMKIDMPEGWEPKSY